MSSNEIIDAPFRGEQSLSMARQMECPDLADSDPILHPAGRYHRPRSFLDIDRHFRQFEQIGDHGFSTPHIVSVDRPGKGVR